MKKTKSEIVNPSAKVLDSFLSINQKSLEAVHKKLCKCDSHPLVLIHGFDFMCSHPCLDVQREIDAQSKIMIGFFFGKISEDYVELIAQRRQQHLFTAIVCDGAVPDLVECDYRFIVNSQEPFDFELCSFAAAKIIF